MTCRNRYLAAIAVAAIAGWLSLSPVALAVDGALTGPEIEERIEGHTGIFPDSDMGIVTAYFAPTGQLRGRVEDRDIQGDWRVEDGHLCMNLPRMADDECRTVVERRENQLQMFTRAGEPDGYLHLKRGNPNDF